MELQGDYTVSATFNVVDLSPYYDDLSLENLRSNAFKQGEDDRDQALTNQFQQAQSSKGDVQAIVQ